MGSYQADSTRRKDAMSKAESKLTFGDRFPYDAPDDWWADDSENTKTPPPSDWAHRAARGVLADLTDRHTMNYPRTKDPWVS